MNKEVCMSNFYDEIIEESEQGFLNKNKELIDNIKSVISYEAKLGNFKAVYNDTLDEDIQEYFRKLGFKVYRDYCDTTVFVWDDKHG